MRQVKSTCHVCGTVEIATFAGPTYRCVSCTEAFVGKIRRLADDGKSQHQIAVQLGCGQNNISRWCIKAGIVTGGAVAQQNVGAVHGIGKPPPKLMPSQHALSRTNVFSLGVL